MFYLFKRYIQNNVPAIPISLRAKAKVRTKINRALCHVSPSPLRPHLFIFVSSTHLISSMHGLLVYWIHTTCCPPGPSHSFFLECSLSKYSFASFLYILKVFAQLIEASPHLDHDLYLSTCDSYDMQFVFLIHDVFAL